MNLYEKIVILDANLEDTAAEETVGKIRDIIINQGGEVLKTEKLGRRKLAYALNKHEKGNYIMFVFKSPSPTIAELEKQCRIMDPIIKFMVIKITKKKQIEAVMASLAEKKQKEEPTQEAAPAEKNVTAEAQPEGQTASPQATSETPEGTENV